ncbi:MAG: hypothetical protein Q8838_02535 [Candidatus Phytoplasma australasiaticum]|nr:hypothetical protein [Candidatus Phytoplasma australasiaticum]
MSAQCNSGKANVIVDALSRLFMGSVGHVDEGKKEWTEDFHRLDGLSVRLTNSNDGGVYVQNGVESYVVVDSNAKQNLYSSLVGLKRLVAKRIKWRFPPGGEMVGFSTKIECMFWTLMVLRK